MRKGRAGGKPALSHCHHNIGKTGSRYQFLLVLVIDADWCVEVSAKIVVALDRDGHGACITAPLRSRGGKAAKVAGSERIDRHAVRVVGDAEAKQVEMGFPNF
jgi:hypothetical protein